LQTGPARRKALHASAKLVATAPVLSDRHRPWLSSYASALWSLGASTQVAHSMLTSCDSDTRLQVTGPWWPGLRATWPGRADVGSTAGRPQAPAGADLTLLFTSRPWLRYGYCTVLP
jgi:hypothetical protein